MQLFLGVLRPHDRRRGDVASVASGIGLRSARRFRARRSAVAEMRGRRVVVELEVVAEHREQMLFEAHHQRMDPGVEDDVRALEAHLRRIAGREILHVHGRRDDRARDAEALGDVALHLRAEHELGLQLLDLRLDFEIVVGDQGLDTVSLRGLADVAGEFAAVGAEADDGETELLRRDAGGGDGVGRVAEDEHALAGEIGGIDRARVPGKARSLGSEQRAGIDAGERCDLGDEVARRADADRHGLDAGLPERPLQPLRGRGGDLRIEHDVEVGVAEAREIGRRRAERRDDMDVDAELVEQLRYLGDVVAMAEAERRRAEKIAARAPAVARAADAASRAQAHAARHRRAPAGRTSRPRPSSLSSDRRAARAARPEPASPSARARPPGSS